MSLAWYSDSGAVLQRLAASKVVIAPTCPNLLDDIYDIERSVGWLKAGGYVKVILNLIVLM